MMRTANPALNDKTFANFPSVVVADEQMTLQGTVNKTAFLLLLVIAPAMYTWNLLLEQQWELLMPMLITSLILGLIVAVVLVFKKTWAPFLAPLYALCQGLMLGAISSLFEIQYPGIVLQAVGLTFGTAAALLLAYTSGWIQVTDNFRLGVVAATGGIMLFYVMNAVLRYFGVEIPYIHESGIIGILFSLFVVVIASLNLVLDFDFIEKGCDQGAPKYMEWYAAFGLMVTLIWLYLEILRLLSKVRGRK